MKNNYSFIIFSLIALVSISCKHEIENYSYQRLSIHPDESINVELKDLFDIENITPLETNDSVLINAIYNILYEERHFYILDRKAASVFIYKDNGEIENVIHSIGNGPEEYNELTGVNFDPFHQQLHLFDNVKKKEYIYSDLGEFIRVDSIPFKIDQKIFLNHTHYVIARSPMDINGGFRVNFYDTNGLTAQYCYFKYVNGATINDWSFPILPIKENIYNHISFNDTIYRFNAERLKGGYIVDFGKFAIPKEIKECSLDNRLFKFVDYLQAQNYKVARSHFLFKEDDDHVYISYVYALNNHFYIYDKHTKDGTSFCGPFIGNMPLTDILYGTFNSNGKLLFVLDKSKYDEIGEKHKQEICNNYPSIYAALEESAIDDNPIIVTVSIRNI